LQALVAVQRSGGTAVSVKAEDVITDQQYLARSGHYLELSAVAALTGLRVLKAGNQLVPRHVVLVATSHGYKESAD
jgi:threonine synthase